jgi:hypothetical protein
MSCDRLFGGRGEGFIVRDMHGILGVGECIVLRADVVL